MSRGDLQRLPAQQMMAGNSNWLNIYTARPPFHQNYNSQPFPYIPSSSSSSSSTTSPNSPFSVLPSYLPLNSLPMSSLQETQDQMPESWSQLLMGGLVGEEDRCTDLNFFQPRKIEIWADQMMYSSGANMLDVVKQESADGGDMMNNESAEIQAVKSRLGTHALTNSSPGYSCLTNVNSNMLDFSSQRILELGNQVHQSDHSPEVESNVHTGTPAKKPRIHSSPSQSTFKVRKEKLGDRITALHQLVSPFGKTDTASVLLEAFGYIRFLQNQIEALSSPYMGGASTPGTMRQQSLVDDVSTKQIKGSGKGGNQEPKRDLKSRGLCIIPLACISPVGNDHTGAEYWGRDF